MYLDYPVAKYQHTAVHNINTLCFGIESNLAVNKQNKSANYLK